MEQINFKKVARRLHRKKTTSSGYISRAGISERTLTFKFFLHCFTMNICYFYMAFTP